MGSLGGSGFEKKRRCPSSNLLLSYSQSDLAAEQTSQVASHIAACGFCAAELQLLSKHPPAEEFWEPAAVPPHLGALAEALLFSRLRPFPIARKVPVALGTSTNARPAGRLS
jgi:hypothetical protein